jgi:hypothetical protein
LGCYSGLESREPLRRMAFAARNDVFQEPIHVLCWDCRKYCSSLHLGPLCSPRTREEVRTTPRILHRNWRGFPTVHMVFLPNGERAQGKVCGPVPHFSLFIRILMNLQRRSHARLSRPETPIQIQGRRFTTANTHRANRRNHAAFPRSAHGGSPETSRGYGNGRELRSQEKRHNFHSPPARPDPIQGASGRLRAEKTINGGRR